MPDAPTLPPSSPAAPPLLRLRGICKRFPGVLALDHVDLTLNGGEVHALLGENGAGKSTLIKVLTGVHHADEGRIMVGETAVRPESPKDAERLGISTVYQEINLVPSLSVAENIALGRQPGRWGFIHWRAVRQRARAALQRLDLECDVDAELGSLSVALQQMVAIARALDVRARVLVLDEPTASLDANEVQELFTVIRRLRAEGMGILFVTHFLDQVYAVCDRLTVLRNGRHVGEATTTELSRLDLVQLMLGREYAAEVREQAPPEPSRGTPVLAARGLGRRTVVEPFDLTLRAGEVSGLAGLLGSGRTETARLLFGVDRPDRGTLEVGGRPVRIASPREAVRLGLAFSSENRKSEGILPNLSVRENLILALQAKQGLPRALSRAEQAQLCEHYIRALRIKTPDAETPIRTLSGGNQQKVLLARWLATRPQLIILDEPTRGIDIGAKQEIEHLVSQLSADGLAVLFISSELEEVVRRCARITILRERRHVSELAGSDITLDRLLREMAGSDHPPTGPA